ncbi:hypothetical protein M728_004284 (plasmid) [Ensifer sp. WSM1721]|uniref:hypothetical protein n=1 Tax=Ensifer sp. WSM1721 TaxID=1041159 RepID=UPI00047B3457|nr:hypothetical protein [Ensifer sp. WSM1721]
MKLRFVLTWLLIVVALTARAQEPREVADWPIRVEELLAVHRFELQEGFEFDWSAEARTVRSGTLVVIKVDPDIVVPRNAPEPILYAGDRTVQRLNRGSGSGVIVGLIPGDIDLSAAPLWFGAPGLPESVTAETIRNERRLAERAEIRPFAREAVERVRAEPLVANDLAELLRTHVADLVLQYAPQERALAESWRLPVVSAPQKDRRP